jgi:undecaprenyl diphosphate synthase
MTQTELDINNLPAHVAIIMDGNGRWAQARGMNRLEGHRAGAESVRTITRAARRLGLKYLTLYTFSFENWQRPKLEVEGLMHLLARYLEGEVDDMMENGVRLNAIGDLDRLPKATRKLLDKTMARTAGNSDMVLSLALSYGGRVEILDTCRRIAEECLAGNMTPENIDDAVFSQHLWTRDIPDPDLLIRTGRECRISNFLLWQIAYAEIYMTDKYWPDFDEAEFIKALIDYQGRQRRFGRTGEQVEVSG